MAAPFGVPTPQSTIAPHLCPIVHTFSTQDVTSILSRSHFNSLSHLLSPFENSIENVTVRSSTYDSALLPRFHVRFVERALPQGFGDVVGTGSGRARSGTLLSVTGSEGRPSFDSATLGAVPPSPSTPFILPTQQQRNELFLDSLSSTLSASVDAWIAHEAHPEIVVNRPIKSKKRYADEGQEPIPDEVEVDEGWRGRDVDKLTPWYASMRDEVFKRREMVPYDTFAWPVACLLAVSTSHPDPLNALSALWDLTAKDKLFAKSSYSARTVPPDENIAEWAEPDILRYVVLVHDFGAGGGRDGWEDAQKLHETISKTYLHHTALLPIFSASPSCAHPQLPSPFLTTLWPSRSIPGQSKPPPIGLGIGGDEEESTPASVGGGGEGRVNTGGEMSDDDLKAVKVFVREMVVQSILPWMERAVIVGNEQYAASKRSIGGRLFSAGRKYFGGSGSRAGSPAAGGALSYNAAKGFYPIAAQEAQTRRLADLAFMIGDYKLAASVYDQASKDYKTDKAWRHYSSACRMAGLAQLLLQAPSTSLMFNPDSFLEQALQTPTMPPRSGPLDFDELHGMLLFYEAYRAIGDWRAAPLGLVRTAGKSDELPSAILLEQAAISDLHLPLTSRRKFGFHMAMAAARYEKAGLKSLSRRCLSQAAALYRLDAPMPHDPRWTDKSESWTSIRAHIHHELGRQAYNVGRFEDAVEHFLELLAGSGSGDEGWLEDFALAWEHLGVEGPRVMEERGVALPVTIFDPKDAHIRVTRQDAEVVGSTEGWEALSDNLVEGGSVGNGRKIAKVTKGTTVVVGETFYLELVARNPLYAPLTIDSLRLETDAGEGAIEVDSLTSIQLAPRESLSVLIPIRAQSLVTFSFTKISFRFHNLLPTTETLTSKSKAIVAKASPSTAPASSESPLKVVVRSKVPILSISLDAIPDTVFAGEVRISSLTLTNSGTIALSNLRAISSHPSFAAFLPPSDEAQVYVPAPARDSISISDHLSPDTYFAIPLDVSDTLAPGASVTVPILVRGDCSGSHRLKWLFSFRNSEGSESLSAHASRELHVVPSLDIRPIIRPGRALETPILTSLEIRNTGIAEPVEIIQITSLSARWRCGPLESKVPLPLAWLPPQQWTNVFVGISAAGKPRPSNVPDFASQKLDDLLQGRDVKQSVPGEISMQVGVVPADSSPLDVSAQPLVSTILRSHKLLRQRSLTNQLPTVPSNLHQYLFTTFNPRSIDLIVFWRVPATGAQGHHHLADIPLSVGTNLLKDVLETAEQKAGGLYAESQRDRRNLLAGLRRSELGVEANPSEVVVTVDELIEHDFSTGPCKVPVTFLVRNMTGDDIMSYTLFLQDSDTSTSSPHNRLPYAGPLTLHGEVAPLSVESVAAQLWITKAGSYEIGDWRLQSKTKTGTVWNLSGAPRTVRIRDVLL